MNALPHAIAAVGLVTVGVVGIYFNVDSAGWSLFTGLLIAFIKFV